MSMIFGQLGVFQHIRPGLFDQFADLFAFDRYRQRDLELVDDPVARVVAHTNERSVRHEVQRSVLVAQRYRTEGDALDGALGVPALDIVADSKYVFDQIVGAAEQVTNQGLRAKADRDADDPGARHQSGDVEPPGGGRAPQRDPPDYQLADGGQQWLHRARPALRSSLLAAQFYGKPG